MKTAALLAVLACSSALAADKKPPAKKEKIDLGIPSFGSIPKGDDVEAPKEKKPTSQPSTPTPTTSYSIVKVQHAKGFTRSATGATPTAPYDAVAVSGNPLMTEKFTTVVRVKCADKKSSDIHLAVMDARGDQVMDAGGPLNFRGQKSDELDYTVDWDPTGVRGPGEYQVVVKVAGQVLGTYPLKVVEKK